LTPSQKKVVAKDYGMAGGKRMISVPHAMLFYVLKRLNLLRDPEKEDPRHQHIVVLNKDRCGKRSNWRIWPSRFDARSANCLSFDH